MSQQGSSRSNADDSSTSKASYRSTAKWSKWRWVLVVLGVLILLPFLVFGVYYTRITIPEPNEISSAQVSRIYASDSETELARIVPPDGNRTQVPLEDVPVHTQNAVLAAEDREFWSNSGFSITGFTRAALGAVTGDRSAGGGSTVTQQYVKNVLVGNERSIERKVKELVYSIKMTNQWKKETILEAYLNTVYFGRNAYGIEAASHAYFDKPASQLTVEEGAVLAASIQAPSQLDPWLNPEEAEARWNYVLDGMVEMGELDPSERAGAVYPETRDPSEYSAYTEATGTNGLIKNRVIAELETLGVTEEDVTTRGLQITTTIDARAQEATIRAVRDNLAGLQDDARAAVVSVDPQTGAVRSYYGGDEAGGWDYANAPVQTGSTFKIFGLAAALQQGIPLTAQYSSAPVTLPGNIQVDNVTGSCGYCSIEQALVRSYNTSFIRLQEDLENTTQDTADMAHALGVARKLPGIPETLREKGGQPYEGVILGQYQSRPVDLAVAMATLANRGVWHETYWVERVETASGEVLYQHESGEGERRVSTQVADNVVKAMGPIAAYSNGNALAGGRPSASKTGTAQLGDTGANKDTWMVGATPQLATAVWVGTADNSSAIYNEWGGNMYGSGAASSIWKDTLDGALEGQPIEQFPTPEPVTYGGFAGPSNYSGGGYVPPVTSSTYTPSYPSNRQGTTTESTTESTTQSNTGGGGAPAPAPAGPAPAQEAPAPAPAGPAPAPAPEPDPISELERLLGVQ